MPVAPTEDNMPRYLALSSNESAKTLYMSMTDINAIRTTKKICIAFTIKLSAFSDELPEKIRTLLLESKFSAPTRFLMASVKVYWSLFVSVIRSALNVSF